MEFTVNYVPREAEGTPTGRFAVLPLPRNRYVVYDRRTFQIVNGVFMTEKMALSVAEDFNEHGNPR